MDRRPPARHVGHPDHAAWLAKERIKQQAYRKKNRDRLNAAKRVRYANNREQEKTRSRRWYHQNKEKAIQLKKRWRSANLPLIYARNRRVVDKATDAYIAKLFGVPMDTLSPEFIEAKRAVLLTKRTLGVTGLNERRKRARHPPAP